MLVPKKCYLLVRCLLAEVIKSLDLKFTSLDAQLGCEELDLLTREPAGAGVQYLAVELVQHFARVDLILVSHDEVVTWRIWSALTAAATGSPFIKISLLN